MISGKWHLGETEEYWPENQGFDMNKGGFSKGAATEKQQMQTDTFLLMEIQGLKMVLKVNILLIGRQMKQSNSLKRSGDETILPLSFISMLFIIRCRERRSTLQKFTAKADSMGLSQALILLQGIRIGSGHR